MSVSCGSVEFGWLEDAEVAAPGCGEADRRDGVHTP